MHIHNHCPLWKTPVEKPVDNVEKLGFSTAISWFFLFASLWIPMHTPLYNPAKPLVACELCRRRNKRISAPTLAKKLALFKNRSVFEKPERLLS